MEAPKLQLRSHDHREPVMGVCSSRPDNPKYAHNSCNQHFWTEPRKNTHTQVHLNTTEEDKALSLRHKLTVQVAARQLQPQAQALGGGSLRVDSDEAGPDGSHQPELRRVVVLIPRENLQSSIKDVKICSCCEANKQRREGWKTLTPVIRSSAPPSGRPAGASQQRRRGLAGCF